ncbi:hypothetical protein CHS0354_000113 [Potamilus streckersoni]|uniref:Torsin-1A C-terminal domain-containing protein n=1 Tax=Potamilus streckersoni TaxID=2493646 RepID=A0AAE0TIN2_9BIVA|nr:hypothetical protein CHS0354_000113 [Potamilus streckersoni]
MKYIKKNSVIFCIYLLCAVVRGEIVSASLAAGLSAIVAGGMAGFNFVVCRFKECCGDRWIHENFTGLAEELNSKLYGQYLVVKPVVNHLKGHSKGNPSKALALSFHGWTGTGKNFVARIIAESMYKKGMSSKYVKLISATKEFPHEEMLPLYKDKLRELIESSVKQCEKTMFIFDEMDKMPPGLIDTIKPYLDYYENLGGVDYRKAIFLFLSNTAGGDIAEEAMKYWNEGKKREDITLKDMELIIQTPALNVKSGLWHSELITKHMITAYIPFLPLERKHVKECIRDGLITGGYYKKRSEIPEVKVSEILEELTFYPEGAGIFSTTGCKRVLEKIDYVMEEV